MPSPSLSSLARWKLPENTRSPPMSGARLRGWGPGSSKGTCLPGTKGALCPDHLRGVPAVGDGGEPWREGPLLLGRGNTRGWHRPCPCPCPAQGLQLRHSPPRPRAHAAPERCARGRGVGDRAARLAPPLVTAHLALTRPALCRRRFRLWGWESPSMRHRVLRNQSPRATGRHPAPVSAQAPGVGGWGGEQRLRSPTTQTARLRPDLPLPTTGRQRSCRTPRGPPRSRRPSRPSTQSRRRR